MQLHADCEPLAFLLGTWRGAGEGEYPTIDGFRYTEEVTFGHVGKPFVAYSQKTKHAETGQPLHAETGYLRALGEDQVEFVVVQPSGIVELHQGMVRDATLELVLISVHTTPAAKSVSDVQRVIHVEDDGDQAVLKYGVAMAAVGEPLTHHLRADLIRQPLV
ncbi:MAG: hypothetical protein ACI8XD_001337 [Thermoproteota archaeon]|jgi:hypothetical protein